jgi:3-hydroxyisobutyrate dehydrogenase
VSDTTDAAFTAPWQESAVNVAFIGVGAMGAPMAACIARVGHSVTVYDSSHEQALKAAENGCRVAAGLDDLAAADIVVTMLPTGQIVRDLYLGEGLAHKLRRGALPLWHHAHHHDRG